MQGREVLWRCYCHGPSIHHLEFFPPPLEFSNFFFIIIKFSVLFSCKYRYEIVRVKVKYPINFSISYTGGKKRTEMILLVFFPGPLTTFTLSITVYPPLEILTGSGWKGGNWGECAGSMQWENRIKTYQSKTAKLSSYIPHIPTFSPVRPLLKCTEV